MAKNVIRAAMSARIMPTTTTMPAAVPAESESDLEKAAVELEAAGLVDVELAELESETEEIEEV